MLTTHVNIVNHPQGDASEILNVASHLYLKEGDTGLGMRKVADSTSLHPRWTVAWHQVFPCAVLAAKQIRRLPMPTRLGHVHNGGPVVHARRHIRSADEQFTYQHVSPA